VEKVIAALEISSVYVAKRELIGILLKFIFMFWYFREINRNSDIGNSQTSLFLDDSISGDLNTCLSDLMTKL